MHLPREVVNVNVFERNDYTLDYDSDCFVVLEALRVERGGN